MDAETNSCEYSLHESFTCIFVLFLVACLIVGLFKYLEKYNAKHGLSPGTARYPGQRYECSAETELLNNRQQFF